MYRFLDKRFYRRSRLDFDLRTLACEHIGLSRSYAPTELKRRLKPALEEMEQLGFLEPLGPEERYSYVKRGCWRIIFIRGRHATAEVQDPTVAARAAAGRAHRGPQGAGSHRQDGPGAGRDAPARPDPHQDRGLRLAVAQRGQAGRQEPGRLPGGLDPIRLPGSRRLSGPGRREPSQQPKRISGGKADSQRSRHEQRQASDEVQAQRDKVREAKLRAAWEQLSEAEREAILATVKAENPGLGRWKNMLEPLCLSALETRMQARPAPGPVNGCSSPTSTRQRSVC